MYVVYGTDHDTTSRLVSSEWALAAADAYVVYGNTAMLDLAKRMWDEIIPYQLSAEEAQRGLSLSQNVTVPSICVNDSELHQILLHSDR